LRRSFSEGADFCFFFTCVEELETSDKKILKQRFFSLLFYCKKVAKSSVKGLSMGAPLLKTDRFGDPTASSRFTDARNLGQHKPAFQFALLHA
jgi:hypothetical protein